MAVLAVWTTILMMDIRQAIRWFQGGVKWPEFYFGPFAELVTIPIVIGVALSPFALGIGAGIGFAVRSSILLAFHRMAFSNIFWKFTEARK